MHRSCRSGSSHVLAVSEHKLARFTSSSIDRTSKTQGGCHGDLTQPSFMLSPRHVDVNFDTGKSTKTRRQEPLLLDTGSAILDSISINPLSTFGQSSLSTPQSTTSATVSSNISIASSSTSSLFSSAYLTSSSSDTISSTSSSEANTSISAASTSSAILSGTSSTYPLSNPTSTTSTSLLSSLSAISSTSSLPSTTTRTQSFSANTYTSATTTTYDTSTYQSFSASTGVNYTTTTTSLWLQSAPLSTANDMTPTSGTLNTNAAGRSGFSKNTGAIIGVSVAAGIGLIAAVILIFFLSQRYRRRRTRVGGGNSNTSNPLVRPPYQLSRRASWRSPLTDEEEDISAPPPGSSQESDAVLMPGSHHPMVEIPLPESGVSHSASTSSSGHGNTRRPSSLLNPPPPPWMFNNNTLLSPPKVPVVPDQSQTHPYPSTGSEIPRGLVQIPESSKASLMDNMDYSRPIGGLINNRTESSTTIQTMTDDGHGYAL